MAIWCVSIYMLVLFTLLTANAGFNFFFVLLSECCHLGANTFKCHTTYCRLDFKLIIVGGFYLKR